MSEGSKPETGDLHEAGGAGSMRCLTERQAAIGRGAMYLLKYWTLP